jgi:hypothetical protein
MKVHNTALAGLMLATSLLATNAMAADTTSKKDGVHTEIRSGAAETPESNKGTGGGILDEGPVKQRKEDQMPGKSEKMNDNQYETDKTKKKGEGANQ